MRGTEEYLRVGRFGVFIIYRKSKEEQAAYG
jgi:hypothetical protein